MSPPRRIHRHYVLVLTDAFWTNPVVHGLSFHPREVEPAWERDCTVKEMQSSRRIMPLSMRQFPPGSDKTALQDYRARSERGKKQQEIVGWGICVHSCHQHPIVRYEAPWPCSGCAGAHNAAQKKKLTADRAFTRIHKGDVQFVKRLTSPHWKWMGIRQPWRINAFVWKVSEMLLAKYSSRKKKAVFMSYPVVMKLIKKYHIQIHTDNF